MEISVNVEIGSPKNKVWRAITDIKNCEKMISGIINLTVLQQPTESLVGLKWTETRKKLQQDLNDIKAFVDKS